MRRGDCDGRLVRRPVLKMSRCRRHILVRIGIKVTLDERLGQITRGRRSKSGQLRYVSGYSPRLVGDEEGECPTPTRCTCRRRSSTSAFSALHREADRREFPSHCTRAGPHQIFAQPSSSSPPTRPSPEQRSLCAPRTKAWRARFLARHGRALRCCTGGNLSATWLED
jgi:hypothetical protein